MKEDPVLPTPRRLGAVPWTGPYQATGGHAMYLLEHDLAQSRMREDQASAEAHRRPCRIVVQTGPADGYAARANGSPESTARVQSASASLNRPTRARIWARRVRAAGVAAGLAEARPIAT